MAKVIVLTCQKCGRQSTAKVVEKDKAYCPDCGVHGLITCSNSQEVVAKNGQHFFIAVDDVRERPSFGYKYNKRIRELLP